MLFVFMADRSEYKQAQNKKPAQISERVVIYYA